MTGNSLVHRNHWPRLPRLRHTLLILLPVLLHFHPSSRSSPRIRLFAHSVILALRRSPCDSLIQQAEDRRSSCTGKTQQAV